MRRLVRSAPVRLAAPLAAAFLAACADSAAPTAPAPPPGPTTPDRAAPPAAVSNLLSGGGYFQGFNFPEARDANGGWALIPPRNWRPTDFDVAIHSRDRGTWYAPDPFRAMHGTMCQPYQDPEPTNRVRRDDAGSHPVETYDELNYRCRNHMMTAQQARGYGVIYVTPNALVDFTGGEATIKFALATLRTSGRDWVDLWITPWEDNLKLPLDGDLPDLQGPPRHAIHVRMTAELTRSAFEAYHVSDFRERKLPVATAAGYERILTPVSTRRDTFELKISRTRLSFGMRKLASPDGPAGAITWVDTPIPPLAFTRGVVQFGHHSFNPAQAANPALPPETGGTWHWDDFQISPAVPFTIVPSDPAAARHADAASPAITLGAPAPANAFLRFAAFGEALEVSTDGKAWGKARRQAEKYDLRTGSTRTGCPSPRAPRPCTSACARTTTSARPPAGSSATWPSGAWATRQGRAPNGGGRRGAAPTTATRRHALTPPARTAARSPARFRAGLRAAVLGALAVGTAWLVAPLACERGDGRRVLTVYSPHGKELLRHYEQGFERLHPGVDVQWVDLGSQEILERVQAERANPQADVWFGAPSDAFARAARQGLLAPYRPTWAGAVPDEARDSLDRWYGTYRTPEVIAYNSKLVAPADAPRDWDDVLLPRWTGKVIIRDPVASGSMRAIFGGILARSVAQTGSTAAGWRWLERLDAQTREYTFNPALMYERLKRGDGLVTLYNMPDIATLERRTGAPVAYVLPASGTPVLVDAVAVLRGARQPALARAYYEYVSTPEALLYAADSLQRIPARTDLPAARLPAWMAEAASRIRPFEADRRLLADSLDAWMRQWDARVRNRYRAR
jgi:iron(III) transport system substrate-binding protein